MGLREDFMEALSTGIRAAGSVAGLARSIGVSPSTVSRWKNGSRIPTLLEGEKLCSFLGLRLVGEDVLRNLSHDEDFVSVPIVRTDMVLRPGVIPAECVAGWCRVDRRFNSVAGKRDLVVVEIGMDAAETIKEGSLVLVDRTRREPRHNRMFLVHDGFRMGVRRIHMAEKGDILWRGLTTGILTCHDAETGRRRIVGRAGWVRANIEDGGRVILDR